ncbi:MAG: hypothetical protein AB7L13_05600 [Acidimicrobiia bacterium]
MAEQTNQPQAQPSGSARPKVTDETRQAERNDANRQHQPDRRPTKAEDKAAPKNVDDNVAEHYEEMMERGANQKGEGRI